MDTRHHVEDAAFPDVVTVGCVNFASVPYDQPATLAKIEARMRDAARQGCDLLVFPETALNTSTPSIDGRPSTCFAEEAETVPGPSTGRLARLAAELDLHIIVGMAERDPVHPDTVYNAAALIGPDGIHGTYRKLHLGHPLETDHFCPGDRLPVWQTRLGPIGILICYDFWSNPELSRVLALKGARLLVNPTRSALDPGKRDYVVNTTVVRAQENLVYACSANWVGPAAGGIGAGQSTIAGPAFPTFNNVFARAGDGEELIVASLNFRQLGRWYDLFPWRSWRLDPERQLHVTRLVAQELSDLARDAGG